LKDFGRRILQINDCDRIETAPAIAGMAAPQTADLGVVCAHAQSAGRTQAAHGLREREVPEPLGMLEQGHGDIHDRGRPLHEGMRVLRGQHGQAR
jgi:hypothetical protein